MTETRLAAVRRRIVNSEGLRLRPYTDTAGRLTIGVGRNLTDVGISHEEALLLLEHDLAWAQAEVARIWPWTSALDDVRLGVVMEMCFNLGASRLEGFVLLATALEGADYGRAAQEMKQSTWAAQVHGRAERLAAIMLSGQDGDVS